MRKRSLFNAMSLFVALNITLPAHAQDSRWTPDEKVANGRWIYSEKFERGKLSECHLTTEVEAVNGSMAGITIAVLQKGSIVIAIQDAEWASRIRQDFGWQEGMEIKNTIIFAAKSKVQASGHILSDLRFVIFPKDRSDLIASDFLNSDSFSVSVGGLAFKAFNIPGVSEASLRLRKCQLLGR